MTKYIIHNFIHLVKNFFRSLLLTQRFVLITFIDYSIIAPLCLPLFYNFFEKGPEKFPATMLYHYLMSDGKHFANSFLSVYYTIGPCRTGNFSQTVSCRYAIQSAHVEQETFRKQFPVAMIHNRSMPDRKLYANSFLPLCCTIVSCRTGNLSQTVSCRYDSQSSHAGQETFRKQFPAPVIRNRHMTNRKLFANSFLSLCCTIVSRRIGNFYANSFLQS